MIYFYSMLLRRWQMWRLLRQQAEIIAAQRLEMQMMQLQYARNIRDLVEQFFIVQEAGTDVRDNLLQGLRDLQDEVARLEEHCGI